MDRQYTLHTQSLLRLIDVKADGGLTWYAGGLECKRLFAPSRLRALTQKSISYRDEQ
jgi:hypothetical protein